jgi:hypothetical protein
MRLPRIVLFSLLAACLPNFGQAAIVISEVHPTGSNATYGRDWFELTNTGAAAINITGWTIDDNSNAFASSAVLRDVTSISAGESVVFIEVNAADLSSTIETSTIALSFQSAWFGSNIPSGFRMGRYQGAGLSFGAGGDAVNIFDPTQAIQASVTFGTSTVGTTFDNAVGASGTISTLSVVGVNGAFNSFAGGEIGSPGTIAAVPEPTTLLLISSCSILGLGVKRFRRGPKM